MIPPVDSLVLVVPVALFFGTVCYLISRFLGAFVPRINRWVRMSFAGPLPLLALFLAGFTAYVDSSFLDWILRRPPWAWTNVAFVLAICCIGAWLPTRGEVERVNTSTFE